MLPQHRDENEDGCNEDHGEGDLRYWAGREGLDVHVRAIRASLFVPAWESGEEEEADEGEDDCDDAARYWVSLVWTIANIGQQEGSDLHEVRKHDAVLERLRHPNQIQRILIYADLLRQESGVVRAKVVPIGSIRGDADAKVADTDFEGGLADNVRDRSSDARVDLGGRVGRDVVVVVKVYEEDAGDERRGG